MPPRTPWNIFSPVSIKREKNSQSIKVFFDKKRLFGNISNQRWIFDVNFHTIWTMFFFIVNYQKKFIFLYFTASTFHRICKLIPENSLLNYQEYSTVKPKKSMLTQQLPSLMDNLTLFLSYFFPVLFKIIFVWLLYLSLFVEKILAKIELALTTTVKQKQS